MMMVSISEKFTRDMEEATRSYKMESSKENSPKKEESPGKEESPKGTSPRGEGSKMNQEEIEKRLKELRESEDQNVERWNTASENLMDDDEKERLRMDLEVRRLRRLERAESEKDVESIKSEENPYSPLGSLTPVELMETGSGEIFNKKVLERKLDQIKERLKEKTQDSLRGLKEHLQKETTPKIKVLKEKETLTAQEDRELKFLRVMREGGSVLEKMTITQLHEILFEEDERKEEKRNI